MSNPISALDKRLIPAGPNALSWLVEFSDANRAPISSYEVGDLCVVWFDNDSFIVGIPMHSLSAGMFDVVDYAGYPDATGLSNVQASRVSWILPQRNTPAPMSLAA